MRNNVILGFASAMLILAGTGAYAQSTEATGNAYALGNAQLGDEVSIGDNVNSRVNNEPAAIAPNLAGLYASPHTCMGSATASVGVGGVFSAGAGSTYQDNECNKREAVKLAAQLGLKQAAAAVFYDIEVVKNTIGVAENADVRAQQEARALAGIDMSRGPSGQTGTAPATIVEGNDRIVTSEEVEPMGQKNETTRTVRANTMRHGVELSDNAPWWCANADKNNARWDECVN